MSLSSFLFLLSTAADFKGQIRADSGHPAFLKQFVILSVILSKLIYSFICAGNSFVEC